jgi:hypothetical protein
VGSEGIDFNIFGEKVEWREQVEDYPIMEKYVMLFGRYIPYL